jgi:hypothetical protein
MRKLQIDVWVAFWSCFPTAPFICRDFRVKAHVRCGFTSVAGCPGVLAALLIISKKLEGLRFNIAETIENFIFGLVFPRSPGRSSSGGPVAWQRRASDAEGICCPAPGPSAFCRYL